jgi:hypothetical protein
VEAGVDFSFHSAFRGLFAPARAPRAGKRPAQAESWGLMNLLQIACLCGAARGQAGRASRSVEYQHTGVPDFRHVESPAFRRIRTSKRPIESWKPSSLNPKR